MFRFLLLCLSASLLYSCGPDAPETDPEMSDVALRAHADSLAHAYIIVDGHVDLPYRLKVKNFRLEREMLGIPIETDEGDFDYVRAVEGGLDAPFMSIYIPSNLQEEKGASPALADSLIDMVKGIIAAHPDKFAPALSPDDIERNFDRGLVSLPMGMENGSPIEDDLSRVEQYFNKGIRYITLTHAKDNLISDSSYDTTGTNGGLSPFGEEVVREMNRVGVMVDVSHISDAAFWDVMEITDVPVIASHSSVRHFTPDFERNMNDEMIKRMGENGGVIQINFGSTFLDGALRSRQDSLREVFMNLLAERGLQNRTPEAEALADSFQLENPTLYSDVEMVADHIDRVVQIAGIDHVGLGSDYDGVGDSLPTGLKDVADYPNLVYVLLKRGYTDEDIQKILSGNVLRVWRAVEAASSARG
ncbi:membrane dipeptidase [Lewinella marina]|uniref:Peptidase M19 n=1 Tax=Neolewinella marina TaxID=438751 RepID=A0A2G0CH78_9BACT|nr:dipeptidase [Neolewinella marina]NJB86192.1 membrane dipeptidase [Neolewinella marina]PHK99332.1 peptidase M19 [Neolewinella marina]